MYIIIYISYRDFRTTLHAGMGSLRLAPISGQNSPCERQCAIRLNFLIWAAGMLAGTFKLGT